jgi:hypothetical protein
MAFTLIMVFADIAKVRVPPVDREVLAAGQRIRDLEGTSIPVILTDPGAGAVLAGLFGERVYAGHWSLTRDFPRKSEQLKKAGVDPSGPGNSGYDLALLTELIRNSGADYVLLRRTTPAMEAIATCSHSKPVFEGDRWLVLGTSGWSCS